jgi:predicted phage terminase large subunit-like protein
MPSPVSIKQVVRYWDKAGTDEKELKKGQDACYTVGVKIAFTEFKKWIVMDVVRGRWETDERERQIKTTAEADGKDVLIYIEQEPGSGGKDSAKSTIRNLAGYHCEANPPVGNKVARADTYSVQVNNGNVQLLVADWNHTYIEEFRFFPFSKYKDQVDASSGAFNMLVQKKQVKVL